ncbi:MAG: SIMPL domain-containing protein [Bacteroidota bacterium]
MKRFAILMAAVCITASTIAQTEYKPVPRTIEVTGSAEMDIEPDEVYLGVNLREYMKDKTTKVSMNEIDKEFQKALAALKIDLKNVSVEGANAYYNYDYNYWRNESKRTDFLAAKTYSIKLPNLEKYNELMQKLDHKGIENAYLQRTDNSKIQEYRQQVKINALKAAKNKAKLMVESIGNQLGDVVFIREMNDGNMYQPIRYKAMSNMAMDTESAGGGEPVQMQKIKIRYEVEAHFFIK